MYLWWEKPLQRYEAVKLRDIRSLVKSSKCRKTRWKEKTDSKISTRIIMNVNLTRLSDWNVSLNATYHMNWQCQLWYPASNHLMKQGHLILQTHPRKCFTRQRITLSENFCRYHIASKLYPALTYPTPAPGKTTKKKVSPVFRRPTSNTGNSLK